MLLRYLFFFILTFSLFTVNIFADGSCSIDGQLSPKLAEYVREINTLAGQLKQKPSSCGGTRSNGIVSNTRRTIDVLDKAKAEIPMMGDIILDFEYNIKMAFNGESRSAVAENGKVFAQMEQTLISTIDVLANKCNLDEASENIITSRIQLNHTLESLYKNTALDYPGNNPGDIPDEYQDLASEIQNTYNPTATQGCKNEYPFEKMSEDIIKAIGKISYGIEAGLKEWKYAIDLIRGGNAVNQEKYTALKRNLLISELQRQGFSAGIINQMVKNLNCVENETRGDDNNPISVALAKGKCMSIEFLGIDQDRFMKKWNKMILGSNGAKTTTSYIYRLNTYKSLHKINVDTATMYSSMQTIFAEDTFVDDEMLTKLIALHITLLDVNDRIEKRIPIMQRNCMKAQPGITGGCAKK